MHDASVVRSARMPGASKYISHEWVVDPIQIRDGAQTCLVRHRRITARNNTTVLRISKNLKWNEWRSCQRQMQTEVIKAVERKTAVESSVSIGQQ